jgi:hypothetical protein
MNHPDRIFCIKGIDTENDLVEVMTNHKWPLCQAFDHNGFFYLNDGDNESEPEYSVLKIDRIEGVLATGKEVGRIKPLGIDVTKAKRFVREMSLGKWMQDLPLMVKMEPEWHHSCEMCRFEEY